MSNLIYISVLINQNIDDIETDSLKCIVNFEHSKFNYAFLEIKKNQPKLKSVNGEIFKTRRGYYLRFVCLNNNLITVDLGLNVVINKLTLFSISNIPNLKSEHLIDAYKIILEQKLFSLLCVIDLDLAVDNLLYAPHDSFSIFFINLITNYRKGACSYKRIFFNLCKDIKYQSLIENIIYFDSEVEANLSVSKLLRNRII